MTEFIRASRLYDVDAGVPIAFDWAKLQPIAESQAEIERSIATVEDRR